MDYTILMYWHLATVGPAFFIGTYLMIVRKGTGVHKRLGKVYMILMLITGVITLFMPARVGPQMMNHFGYIHLFSVLTLYSVPRAYFAINNGDVSTHRYSMIGLYVGGLLIAGGFTFFPGRYMYELFFG